MDNITLAGDINQWTGDGPVWCPVATMGAERSVGPRDASESRAGTRHFAPGARLYLRHTFNYSMRRGGEDYDIEVVGRHRATHRFVRLIVCASWLEKWHADLVYSPTAIRLLWPYWDGTEASKATATTYISYLKPFDTSSQASTL